MVKIINYRNNHYELLSNILLDDEILRLSLEFVLSISDNIYYIVSGQDNDVITDDVYNLISKIYSLINKSIDAIDADIIKINEDRQKDYMIDSVTAPDNMSYGEY